MKKSTSVPCTRPPISSKNTFPIRASDKGVLASGHGVPAPKGGNSSLDGAPDLDHSAKR